MDVVTFFGFAWTFEEDGYFHEAEWTFWKPMIFIFMPAAPLSSNRSTKRVKTSRQKSL